MLLVVVRSRERQFSDSAKHEKHTNDADITFIVPLSVRMPKYVSEVIRFNVYRDGGSIGASYLSIDGVECTLVFKIELVSSGGAIKRRRYRFPLLKKHNRLDYVSPITGVSSPNWKTEAQTVDWEVAKKILGEISTHRYAFEANYAWVFEDMIEVANSEDHSVTSY